MITPVDIDKLKELIRRATAFPWCVYSEPDVGLPPSLFAGRGPTHEGFGPLEPLQGYDLDLAVAAVNSLPALIAKAERVDALTEALSVGETMLNKCMSAWSCGEPEHRVRAMLDAADAFRAKLNEPPVVAARNALSPKESE